MRRSVVLGCFLLAASAAPALAQPAVTPTIAPPGAMPPARPTTEPAPSSAAEIPRSAGSLAQISETAVDHLEHTDAASDRAFLSPTGFTAPKGAAGAQIWLPAYPVGLLAAGTYAVTSRIEVGAGGFAAFDKDGGDAATAGYFSAKLALVRRPTAGVAVQLQYLGAPDDSSDALTFLSAAASKCLGASCRAVISAHVTVFPTTTMATDFGPAAGTNLHVVPGASLIYGSRTKLVLDAVAFEDRADHGFGLYAGLRAARHRWSLDGGFATFSDGDHAKVIPLPLVAAALRF